MYRERSSQRPSRTSTSLMRHVMRQGDHPADRRLGHRAIDRAGGDEDDYVGLGARRHVDGVVADAEPADRQQVAGLRHSRGRDRRRQHDDALGPGDLVGPHFRTMLRKTTVPDVCVWREHG